MKSYQDPDPLHGNGKAVPKPKQPTQTKRCIIVGNYARRGIIEPVRLTRLGNPARPWPI